MYTFLVVLFVVLSVVMVIVILMQAGKGQGLAGAIGGGAGGSSVFGGRGAADFLGKATSWIAASYMILALIIGYMYKSEAEESQQSLIQKRVEEQQAIPTPNIPVAPIEESGQE
ncbi:MAG: preprotein translocase subunit SecG [Calditrichales bacterium]|nr:preprotein translocase subunit SecG [Calditrichales bacterium]